MPASRIAHIARIQSKATGHSYNAVLHQLVERNLNSGLLPAILSRNSSNWRHSVASFQTYCSPKRVPHLPVLPSQRTTSLVWA